MGFFGVFFVVFVESAGFAERYLNYRHPGRAARGAVRELTCYSVQYCSIQLLDIYYSIHFAGRRVILVLIMAIRWGTLAKQMLPAL